LQLLPLQPLVPLLHEEDGGADPIALKVIGIGGPEPPALA